MKLDKTQVKSIIEKLIGVRNNQEEILRETDTVMNNLLPNGWECDTQKAYHEVYIAIRDKSLQPINELINMFNQILTKTLTELNQAEVDLASLIRGSI